MHNADELDRDLKAALDLLDYPVQPISADAIIQRARARSATRRWRIAAAAIVMLTAFGAAALPGSPVRRWVVEKLTGSPQRPLPSQTGQRSGPPLTTSANTAGVVTFVGDSVDVHFVAAQDSGAALIRLIPEPELRVRATDAQVGYSVRANGILVNNAGSSARYDVEVSEHATVVRVLVRGRAVFVRRAGRIVTGQVARGDRAYEVSLR